MSQQFLQIAVNAPLYYPLSYLPGDLDVASLQSGMRIKVPFRGRESVGVFLGVTDYCDVAADKLKVAIEVLDKQPLLPEAILKLGQWVSDYYHYPVGEVLLSTIPTLLRRGRDLVLPEFSAPLIQDKALQLNTEQQAAFDAIHSADAFKAFLLQGVTGSGKTEVYLRAVAEILKQGKQALVLVPEIGLTPQMLQRFQSRFNLPIAYLHSGLTDKQRLLQYSSAALGQARIVIGTRSAIFTPMPELGLIVVDEEHDLSFKQHSGLRYSARDVAVRRAHFANIPVVLGSATPSLESLYNVEQKRYQLLRLSQRAGNAKPPIVSVLNLQNQQLEQGLSSVLLKHIEQHLSEQGQVMLFLNRRGMAPVLLCHHCGWIKRCDRCDSTMTLHGGRKKTLRCHHCDAMRPVPETCEECGKQELIEVGLGTQKLEETMQRHFPQANVVRIDRDSTARAGELQTRLQQVESGEANIIIGTQMLAKGHHFPNLSLVAILDVDGGLFSADFRAIERLGQLLVQVSGRAGRAEKVGQVLLQTHQPEHPLLQLLLQQGYMAFAKQLLQERQAASLPPVTSLTLLRAEATKASSAEQFLQQAKRLLSPHRVTVVGPMPALMEKRAGRYRFQLLLQAQTRTDMQMTIAEWLPKVVALPASRKVRWSLDVDSLDLS